MNVQGETDQEENSDCYGYDEYSTEQDEQRNIFQLCRRDFHGSLNRDCCLGSSVMQRARRLRILQSPLYDL
jgi:hypothetical protein